MANGSDPPNVVLHLSVFNAPHLLGGGGGDLAQNVFNLYEKGHHEPLLFQLLKCNRAQFLDCGCPCCSWAAPNQAFVPGFWEISIFLCVSQNFQHADRKESVKFLIYVQSESINAWRGSWDLPLESPLYQFQRQRFKKCWGQPLQDVGIGRDCMYSAHCSRVPPPSLEMPLQWSLKALATPTGSVTKEPYLFLIQATRLAFFRLSISLST